MFNPIPPDMPNKLLYPACAQIPFGIVSIAVAEKYLLEPAEGLEEGYKKLSIKVKLVE